jgi:hypothetical protein
VIFAGAADKSVTVRAGALAQQIESGSAEHLAFEHFDAVHVAFDDAGTPRQSESCGDRGEVAFEADREAVQLGQVVAADGVEPCGEQVAAAFGENTGEGADVAGQCVDLGAAREYRLESEAFTLVEAVRVAQDPSGDCVWGRRSRGDLARLGPLVVDMGANASVTSLISLGFDLLPELPGVRAALGPAFVELGFEGVEFARAALPLTVKQGFGRGSVGVLQDRVQPHAQSPGDGPSAVACGEQFVNSRVPGSGPVGEAMSGRPRLFPRLIDLSRR